MDTFSEEALALVETYFQAWEEHDVELLDKVFDENATYSINGEVTFISKDQINKYWLMNSARQRNVRCKFSVTSLCPGTRRIFVAFLVKFYGLEERALVTISGSGFFLIDSSGKCSSFDEHYIKTEASAFLESIKNAYHSTMLKIDDLWSQGRFFLNWAGSHIISLAYPVFTILYLSVFVFAIYMNFFDETNGPLFSTKEETAKAGKIVNASFAVSSVAMAMRDWFKKSRDNLLRRKRVPEGSVADLELMCREMKSASSVLIHSGDFSFVSKHRQLSEILYHLAQRDNLKLVSYKSQDEVTRASLGSVRHAQMINRLVHGGNIRFDAPERVKYSLVRRPGGQSFLFRYEEERGIFVVALSDTTAIGRALIDTVTGLTNSYFSHGR